MRRILISVTGWLANQAGWLHSRLLRQHLDLALPSESGVVVRVDGSGLQEHLDEIMAEQLQAIQDREFT